MRLRSMYIALTTLCLLTSTDAHAIPVFTDWTTVDPSADSASGTLNGMAVSLTGFDLFPSVTNGTSTFFSNATVFSPALASSDYVQVTGSFTTTFTYTVTFSAPVTDPIMHVASLASTLHFPGITLTKVSGETNFVVSGTDVTGELVNSNPCCGTDRNGTILLNGTFASFTFTADALGLFTNERDGIAVQVGAAFPAAAPEPGTMSLLGGGLAVLLLLTRCRKVGKPRGQALFLQALRCRGGA